MAVIYFRLTASEFNRACLIIHGVSVEYHVAGEGQGEALTVENRSIWGETDQTVRNGDRMEHACLEVPNEDIRGPYTIELVVVQGYTGNKETRRLHRMKPDRTGSIWVSSLN